MKYIQKIVSVFLSFCIVLSMLPVTLVRASENEHGEVTVAEENGFAASEATEASELAPETTFPVEDAETEMIPEETEMVSVVSTEHELEETTIAEELVFDNNTFITESELAANNYHTDNTFEGTLYVSSGTGHGETYSITLNSYSEVIIEYAANSPNNTDFYVNRLNPTSRMEPDSYNRFYYDGEYGYGRYRVYALPVGEYRLVIYPDALYDSLVKYWVNIKIRDLPHNCLSQYTREVVEPTCTSGGWTKKTCTKCWKTWNDETTPALGHNEIPTPYIEPTCTTVGKTEGTKCSRCNLVMQAPDTVPMLPHTPVEIADIPPACEVDGKENVTICSKCNNFLEYTVIPDLGGHVYREYGNRVCYRCGAVDESKYEAYGDCGDNVKWFVDNCDWLYIAGSGDMFDYADGGLDTPWNANVLTRVYIEEGVTSIGDNAFDNSFNLTYVEIPDSVRRIGKRAFTNSGILSLELPSGVRVIEESAFSDCDQMSRLTLSEGLLEIGASAFKGCAKLVNLEIPDTVTTLGESCFAACRKIEEASIGRNVEEIPNYAFINCSKLDYISLRSKGRLTSIGKEAFYGCALTVIRLPYGVTTIGDSAFEEVPLMEATLPSTLETVGNMAFYGCNSLRNVYYGGTSSQWGNIRFGSGNSVIRDATKNYADYGYTGTVKWTVEGYNTLILSGSGSMLDYSLSVTPPWYGDRSSIYNVIVGENVTYIGGYVFKDCTILKYISFEGEAPQFSSNAFYGITATVYYQPSASWIDVVGNNYGGTITWVADCGTNHREVVLPAVAATCTEPGLTEGRHCSACGLVFSSQQVIPAKGHKTVKDLAVSPTCTQAGSTEGSHCSTCEAVITPVTILPALGHKEVRDQAIVPTCTESGLTEGKHCSVCSAVLVGQTVVPALGHTEVIDAAITPTCTEPGLTQGKHCSVCNAVLMIQTTVPATGHAYVDCVCKNCGICQLLEGSGRDGLNWKLDADGLLTISGSGEMWDTPWEDYSNRIRTVKIEEGVTSLASGAFEGCVNLTNVSIASTVTILESSVFKGCTALTEIRIPVGVTEVGMWAFNNCTNLVSVIIPETVKAIGSDAFRKCSSLVTITIPEGVETLDSGVFRYCSALTTVVLPKSLTSVGGELFEFCSNLTSVNIPTGLTELSRNMFSGCSALNTITIPNSINTIGERAFAGCTSLTTLNIPKSVTSIGEGAFGSCDALTAIIVNSANREYASDSYGVLFNKKKTTLIQIPGGFSGSYSVPEKVTTIANGAASGCAGLNQITLPKTLTVIEDYAFSSCTTLTDLWFSGSAPVIGEQAFYRVMMTARYPAGDESWTENVRQNYGGTVSWMPSCSNGHMEVIQPAVVPTCTETGLSEGKYCSACGDILVQQMVVAAKGHSEVKVDAVPVSCTEAGLTEGKYCIDCNLILEEQTVIPALGHSEVIVSEVAPTCNKSGLTEGRYCEVCAEVIVPRELIPALDHSYDEGECQICGALDQGDYQVLGGKSLSLKYTDPETGKVLTSKQITWSLPEEYAPYATVTAAGKVTAKKVVEQIRIKVIGTILGGEETQIVVTADIYPAVTHLEIYEDDITVNGKTLTMDINEDSRTFTVQVYPLDAMDGLKWTISDSKNAYASYEIVDNVLTVSNPTGKTGTVTGKVVATDGSNKNATFKLQFAAYARTVTIDKSITTLTAGDKAVQLTATMTPDVVTKSGIVWSLKNAADKSYVTLSSAGKITPKNVLAPVDVTIVATSKDGMAKDEHTIRILPKSTSQLVLKSGEVYITKTTQILDVNKQERITISAHTYGEEGMTIVDWTTKSNKVANIIVNEDGSLTVQMIATGSVTITAKTADKRSATVTIKGVKQAQSLTISQKKTNESRDDVLEVASGKSLDLQATLVNAANKKVTWSVEEGAQSATVSTSGKVTANKNLTRGGRVVIRATAADGSGATDTIAITVRPLAQGVQVYSRVGERTVFAFRSTSLQVRSNTTVNWDLSTQADTIGMEARVYPYYGMDNAKNAIQAVTWKSSAPKIVEIVEDADGNISLKIYKTGSATITVTAADGSGQKISFKLNVVKTVTSLTIADQTVKGGKSISLTKFVTINPNDTTNKKLTWTIISGSEYATISNGNFKAKKVTETKTVEVKVASQDGGASTTFYVTITP